MNQEIKTANELWEYLVLQRSIFTNKIIGIISRNNKFYNIDIKNGEMWINYPSWASSIKQLCDLSTIHYPVRIHTGDYPPFECLVDLWKASGSDERFGQWFINRYGNNYMNSDIFYCEDTKLSMSLIYNKFYGII